MSKYSSASFILPQSPYIKSGEIEVLKPTDSTGNFTVSRASKARLIDVTGADVEVLNNVPVYDYRGDYVAPTDDSFYVFDGVSSFIRFSDECVSSMAADFEISGRIKTPDDISSEQVLLNYYKNSSNRFGINIYNNKINTAVVSPGGTHIKGHDIIASTDYYLSIYWSFANQELTILLDLVNQDDVGVFPHLGATSSFFYINTTDGNLYKSKTTWKGLSVDNYILTTQERLDRYNGLPIPNKYKGVTNEIIGAGSLYIGETYVIGFLGTTDFTVAGALSNAVGEVFECTAIAPGSGTVFKAGNTLDLSNGKTNGIWYDREHNIQGVVNGAVLNNSTDFGNNIYPTETCPSLLTQGQDITNRFQDSANPVTQTINGLTIGVPQTLSCKGSGVVTIVETSGSLLGGAATEVYPFTFTPTHTSVNVTLSAGHTLEHVNLTDTPYAVNHILTPNGGIATRLRDEINGGGDVNTYNSEDLVFMIETKAFKNDLSFRGISASDGTINNRVAIDFRNEENLLWARYIKNGVVEGNITSITSIDLSKNNKIAVRVKVNNFSLWVNGIKLGLDLTVDTIPNGILDRINLDRGDGADKLSAKTKNIIFINEYYTDTQMVDLTTN